jgi:hypothetical protein
MRTVTVDRNEFLQRVQQNRDNHRAVFEEAVDGYRNRLLAELERRIRDLKRGRHIDQYIGLPEPEDHTDDYDRIIAMAQMSVTDTLELTDDEFAMFVMDQWRWKQSFTDSTHRYLR